MLINQEILLNLLPLSNEIQRILVVRLSSIGDVVLISALLRCVRKTYPHARIDFVVKKQFVSLVAANPHVNTVYTLDTSEGFAGLQQLKNELKKQNYDVFLITHKNYRTLYLWLSNIAKHSYSYKKETIKRTFLTEFGINLYKNIRPVFLRYIDSAKKIGVSYDGLDTEFFIPDEQRTLFNEKYKSLFNDELQLIALCPGASYKNKQWLPECFIALSNLLLHTKKIQIVLLGGKAEIELSKLIEQKASSKILNLTGLLSLTESALVLERAKVTVANDTGMLHLSEALQTPVVGIYGPTSRQLGFYPILTTSAVAEVALECRPCTKMGLNHCPKKHFRCMKEISPAMVYSLIMSINPV